MIGGPGAHYRGFMQRPTTRCVVLGRRWLLRRCSMSPMLQVTHPGGGFTRAQGRTRHHFSAQHEHFL